MLFYFILQEHSICFQIPEHKRQIELQIKRVYRGGGAGQLGAQAMANPTKGYLWHLESDLQKHNAVFFS